MKMRMKKILAREFMFLLGSFVFGVIIYFTSFEIRDYYQIQKNQIDRRYENLLIGHVLENTLKVDSSKDFQIDLLFTSESKLTFFDLNFKIDTLGSLIDKDDLAEFIDRFILGSEKIIFEGFGSVAYKEASLDDIVALGKRNVLPDGGDIGLQSIAVGKVKYIESRFDETVKIIDDYFINNIKRDLSRDLKFLAVKNKIDSENQELLNSKGRELRIQLFLKEITNKEANEIWPILNEKSRINTAEKYLENDYMNDKFIEVVSQYENDWNGFHDKLSEKTEGFIKKVLGQIEVNTKEAVAIQGKKFKRTEIALDLAKVVTMIDGSFIFALFFLFFVLRYLIYATKWSLVHITKK